MTLKNNEIKRGIKAKKKQFRRLIDPERNG